MAYSLQRFCPCMCFAKGVSMLGGKNRSAGNPPAPGGKMEQEVDDGTPHTSRVLIRGMGGAVRSLPPAPFQCQEPSSRCCFPMSSSELLGGTVVCLQLLFGSRSRGGSSESPSIVRSWGTYAYVPYIPRQSPGCLALS